MKWEPCCPLVSVSSLTFLSQQVLLHLVHLIIFRNCIFRFYLYLYFVNFESISLAEKAVIRTIVAVLGKSMSEASFTIMFLYTTELYPTVVRLVNDKQLYQLGDNVLDWDDLSLSYFVPSPRQNGLGYTSFLARLGVSISPLIMLLDDVWHLLPAATYCAVAVGSGLVTSLLPETLNTQMPELIEDIERPR